jgi:hypothetical protein
MSERASEEQARRIGLNEAVFRGMNEQLKTLAGEAMLDDHLLLVCECGHEECEESLSVSAAEYEQIRSDARVFAMAPGHELEAVEEVVAVHKGFNVVRKRPGTPARVAQETDPRSD